MTAICRNGHCPKKNGEYDPTKSSADYKGYCTQKCMKEAARNHGWSEATEKKRGGLTAYQVLKNRGLIGTIKKPRPVKGVDKVLTPLGEPSTALMVLSPGAQEIARRFTETELTFKLRVPDEETLELLKDPDLPRAEAEQLLLETDDDYKMMDLRRVLLLDEADIIDDKRTDEANGTGGLNKVKAGWDVQFMPAIKGRREAAIALAERMKDYDRRKQEATALIQAEQQRLAEEEQNRLDAAARELEAKAEKAKGAKKEELQANAHAIRRAAQTAPTGFTSAGYTSTQTAGSSKAALWKGKVTDTRQALETLLNILGPEWLEMVLFQQGILNNLGKMNKNSRELPGFEFFEDTNFRRGKR